MFVSKGEFVEEVSRMSVSHGVSECYKMRGYSEI